MCFIDKCSYLIEAIYRGSGLKEGKKPITSCLEGGDRSKMGKFH